MSLQELPDSELPDFDTATREFNITQAATLWHEVDELIERFGNNDYSKLGLYYVIYHSDLTGGVPLPQSEEKLYLEHNVNLEGARSLRVISNHWLPRVNNKKPIAITDFVYSFKEKIYMCLSATFINPGSKWDTGPRGPLLERKPEGIKVIEGVAVSDQLKEDPEIHIGHDQADVTGALEFALGVIRQVSMLDPDFIQNSDRPNN